MNSRLPTTLAIAMLSMAPRGSVVHQIIREDQAKRIDSAMHVDKLNDGYSLRSSAMAMRLQIERQGATA